MKRHSQRGVALVITLIMLSVITLLTVAFLAISRRNKEAVGTSQTQVDAKAMTDAALARAQAEIIARMLSSLNGTNTVTNLMDFNLTVSTNYINPVGYDNTKTSEDPLNVNYDRYTNGAAPLNPNDYIRNIGNLAIDPRAPVFVVTNVAFPNNLEFRYYLDLNENGRPDTNGLGPELDRNGNIMTDTNGAPILQNYVGDPEWIGVLERPDAPHSGTNRFVGRYCYLVLPVGKSLDLNYIHNQAKLIAYDQDGFLRNQGYGSWELNLAAFLADLNTNYWNPNYNLINAFRYSYITNGPPYASSTGLAFDDARELLRYRYSPTRKSSAGNVNLYQKAAQSYFPVSPADFQIDSIDNYADGPLVMSNSFSEIAANQDQINLPWAGSDNTNRYFSLQDELLDSTKIVPTAPDIGFVGRLKDAGKQTNSYDRYTFYRLLSQMASDSTSETGQKININYKDPLNFVRWTNDPVEFFTNTAMRLLSAHYGTTITNINIQVYSTNTFTNYAPEVHRLLQLAANIYDATITNDIPSVFRPRFSRDGNGNVFITEYVEQNSQANPTNFWSQIPKVVNDPSLAADDIVYGIPFVIGAKKGLPNLNEVTLQSLVKLTRRMDIHKPKKGDKWTVTASGWETNQLYTLGVRNLLGIEAWNSYTNRYPRPVVISVKDQLTFDLASQFGSPVYITNSIPNKRPPLWAPGGTFPKTAYSNTVTMTVLANSTGTNNWQGMTFRMPIVAEMTNLLSSYFVPPTGSVPKGYFQEAIGAANWETNNNNNKFFWVPEFGLNFTNRMLYLVTDNGKIIDFANVGDMVVTNNLYTNLTVDDLSGVALWDPSRADGSTNNNINRQITGGMQNQIYASLGVVDVDWKDYPDSQDKECGIAAMRAFMWGQLTAGVTCSAYQTATNVTVMQTPFVPSWFLAYSNSWQVNDPLVHYTLADFKLTQTVQPLTADAYNQYSFIPNCNLGKINDAYDPWGGPPNAATPPKDAYDLKLKDPLVRQSSDWDFPTNLFPSIGWLGRIHRGTPWQTVYLKADVSPTNEWQTWSGHTNLYPNGVPVAFYTHPTNDWKLLDLFTIAPNDNASHGLLSVNQTNLAAWSAALSGVIVLSNSLNDSVIPPGIGSVIPAFTPMDIQPSSWQLSNIWFAIRSTNVALNGFTHMGDLMAVPQLTTASPFLNVSSDPQKNKAITDAAYERIPQQILSLLKLGEPRFVIYTWGQSLKPAENSVVFNPPSDRPELQNVCTNYQITGEVATRAVVRIEARRESATKTNYQAIVESYNILPRD